MSQEHLKQALKIIDDPDMRKRVIDGDYSMLEGLDLSDEDREVVQQAASNYPEVVGFSFESFLSGEFSSTRGLTADNSFEKWVQNSQFGKMGDVRKSGA